MSALFARQERELCQLFAAAARGPRRNGLFAVWLILRVAGDATHPSALSERGHRRRAEALLRRLSSLTLPPDVRAALQKAARQVGQQPMPAPREIFLELHPHVREALGPRVAAVLASAAQVAPM